MKKKSHNSLLKPSNHRFPVQKEDWLALGLKRAGIGEKELAAAVKEAFEENKRLLHATKKEIKIVDGVPVEVEVADNPARQRAIESIYDLAGARRERDKEPGHGGPTIVLNLPNYYDPNFLKKEGVIDVTPQEEKGDNHDKP